MESGSFSYLWNSVCKYIRNSAEFRVNFTVKIPRNSAEFYFFQKIPYSAGSKKSTGHPIPNSPSQGVANSPTRQVDSPTRRVGESFFDYEYLREFEVEGGTAGKVVSNFCKNPRKSASLPCPFKQFGTKIKKFNCVKVCRETCTVTHNMGSEWFPGPFLSIRGGWQDKVAAIYSNEAFSRLQNPVCTSHQQHSFPPAEPVYSSHQQHSFPPAEPVYSSFQQHSFPPAEPVYSSHQQHSFPPA